MKNETPMTRGNEPYTFGGLLGCELIPMSLELSKTFTQICMISLYPSGSSVRNGFADMCEANDPGYRVIVGRYGSQQKPVCVDATVVALCSILAEGIPGRWVMWAYTLYKMTEALEEMELLTIDHWTANFPHGIPPEHAYHERWQQQKGFNADLDNTDGHIDNILDSYDWGKIPLPNDVTVKTEAPIGLTS
jgi:hypothetical protein